MKAIVAGQAFAHEGADAVDARCIIDAIRGQTFVDVVRTVVFVIASRTRARIVFRRVVAYATVFTILPQKEK